jgi:hypothetical protein
MANRATHPSSLASVNLPIDLRKSLWRGSLLSGIGRSPRAVRCMPMSAPPPTPRRTARSPRQ